MVNMGLLVLNTISEGKIPFGELELEAVSSSWDGRLVFLSFFFFIEQQENNLLNILLRSFSFDLLILSLSMKHTIIVYE